MKANQIFKATELAKQFPVLTPSIDNRDFIHVAMVHDVVAERFALISYIWDTREVTQTSRIEHGTEEYDTLVYISKCFRMSISGIINQILADDNLTWLRLTATFDFNAEDYIDFINREVMVEPRKVKLTCKSTVLSNGYHKMYYLDGQPICQTRKYTEAFCSIDKKTGRRSNLRDKVKNAYSTEWNLAMLRNLFGTQTQFGNNFEDDYPSLSTGYQGSAMTKSAIKQALLDTFNIKF